MFHIWDFRYLQVCQFSLNLFWDNAVSWETNGKMYLFAFLGVDLKFAVSVWAYFRLNHHRIQQTALHRLVLYLQEYLDFHSSHPGQSNLHQIQFYGSNLDKWIDWSRSYQVNLFCFSKRLSRWRRNLMLWHFLHSCQCISTQQLPKWDFCHDTSLCWGLNNSFHRFSDVFFKADIDEGGFSLAASPPKSLIHCHPI